MFTVARSGAVSVMYSGDAPTCLIMHKCGECATKEISCFWLELFLVPPLCCFDCLSTAMVYIEHSYAADLSCSPEELIYSEIYWVELPRFVMTDSRGEEECGVRTQHSDYRTLKTKLMNFLKCSIYCRSALEKGPKTPGVHYYPVPGQLIWRGSVKSRNNVQGKHSARQIGVVGQRWAKMRQPSIFIMLETAFLVALIPFCHAMCWPNLCWPCTESRRLSFQVWQQECRWAHPHEGAGRSGRCTWGEGRGVGEVRVGGGVGQMLQWRWASWEFYID